MPHPRISYHINEHYHLQSKRLIKLKATGSANRQGTRGMAHYHPVILLVTPHQPVRSIVTYERNA